MLVAAVAVPVSVLAWSYVQGASTPIALVAGAVAAIAAIVAIRADLLRRAGIADWSVPLTVSVTALVIATTSVSMTELSRSAARAQRGVDRLAAAALGASALDGQLLRATRAGDAADDAKRAWATGIDRVQQLAPAARTEANAYRVVGTDILRAAGRGQRARSTALLDGAAISARRALSSRIEGELVQRRRASAEAARTVRLFSVSLLTLTLFVVAGLLLRFNAARRRIDRKHQETHDDLTGLPNRVALDRELRKPLAGGTTGERAIVLLDLDDFKGSTTPSGMAPATRSSRSSPGGWRACSASDHMVVRVDGDAFAVLVPAGANAIVAAQRVVSALAEPFDLRGTSTLIHGSIGIADVDESGPDEQAEAIRDAELAMYQAKHVTGNSVERYESDLHERVRGRRELEADLRAALDGEGGLHLAYQPIVDLMTGTVAGYEALIRWSHPTRGPLSPAEFVPIAEQSGLIVDLGDWVLRTATKQLAAWQTEWQDGRYVSVNIAAAQLTTQTLYAQVDGALTASGLDPKLLLLEVTESSLIEDLDGSIAQMARLRDRGVRFALDDFGTGYSSLSYLRRFPVDVLKVDKSFIDALADPDGHLLVRAIVDMATSLRLRVVAEGIEEPEQALALQSFGCELGQGYHFSRPAPPLDIQASPGRSTCPRAGCGPCPKRAVVGQR